LQVSRFAKNDFIRCESIADANDGKANRTGDLLAVGHDKGVVLLLTLDADLLQSLGIDPGEFRACVHEHFRDFSRLFPVNLIFQPGNLYKMFPCDFSCCHFIICPPL
jgi:hypothetical protein